MRISFNRRTRILLTPGSDNGTPMPRDEPLAENPPYGAMIDYYLKANTSGPLTIEILDPAGEVIRKYSSEDKATSGESGHAQHSRVLGATRLNLFRLRPACIDGSGISVRRRPARPAGGGGGGWWWTWRCCYCLAWDLHRQAFCRRKKLHSAADSENGSAHQIKIYAHVAPSVQIVGAALRGRPFVRNRTIEQRAATEGRPYNNARQLGSSLKCPMIMRALLLVRP